MYQFSRSIFRELAPLVVEDPRERPGAHRRRMLEACEQTMSRIAEDGRHFANPARTLFAEVRTLFSINDQAYVYEVIDRRVRLAVHFATESPNGAGMHPRASCRAFTRKGTPCEREPLPGRDYCPSHKHLEEVAPSVNALPTARELEAPPV